MIQSLKMALKSIAGNKIRAFLTMLGIIIGVLTLVVLVSLVSGTTQTVTDTISALGTDLLTVEIDESYARSLTMDDMESWMDEESISAVAAIRQTSMTGKYAGTSDSITVYGTNPAYYDAQNMELLFGRFLKSTDLENSTYVCVLSKGAAEALIGYADCLGHEISLDGIRFTVVGVLAEDEDSLTAAFSSGSAVAYVPFTTLSRVASDVARTLSTIYVAPAEGVEIETLETVMGGILFAHFEENEDAYTIESQNIIEDAMASVTDILALLLGGIAGVSLIVGGIGIMNIMLVTVMERTREIGIRKAIGASRGVILMQFLMEAVVLSLMGCALGILLSWILLQVLSSVLVGVGVSFTLQGGVVAIAVVFCALIGVIFGLYPANKAAKMPPVEALRYGG